MLNLNLIKAGMNAVVRAQHIILANLQTWNLGNNLSASWDLNDSRKLYSAPELEKALEELNDAFSFMLRAQTSPFTTVKQALKDATLTTSATRESFRLAIPGYGDFGPAIFDEHNAVAIAETVAQSEHYDVVHVVNQKGDIVNTVYGVAETAMLSLG